MKQSVVESMKEQVRSLIPSMKTLRTINEVSVTNYIQAKADGEAEYLNYNRVGFPDIPSKAYTVNKWGKLRYDYPAINQFINAMERTTVTSAELLCEFYARENDKPLNLPQFIHYVKSKLTIHHQKCHLGIWDVRSVNDILISAEPPLKRWQLIESWIQGCPNVHVLPYARIQYANDIQRLWDEWVEQTGYEGIVVRDNNRVYKVKPFGELDAVIIGINKPKSNLFAQKQVTSLKLALMTPNGLFAEIGDCASGITYPLRSKLWKLMDYKIAEDDQTVWIKPMIVVTVEYTDLFKGKNKTLQLTPNGYTHMSYMNLIRFKHPRLTHFRPDKAVTPEDLRITQIPEAYLEE